MLWLLVLAIFTSQWFGFAHRMSHMSTNAGQVLSIAFDGDGKFELRKLSDADAAIHSCLLVDAGSIVDGVQHAVSWHFAPVPIPRLIADKTVFNWLSTLRLSFLSRAPPV
ncbi:hypothetical protein H8K35_10895 [Undibacterium sp. LX40W]|uniref:Uncharacterized protein n=1 Tax=Undibacterium nitidum TaxID=2762298 RepID=A0A923KLG9_9BURK|nr:MULTISPECIES: hypothetical protein [Undibacterium]MBC3881835.1 hypothetical protein [Undibacterium nitidum]MBC3892168.1 hypothetical protein [Undibacterium sp. LX40W]